ncbi:MAG: CPBP family intramembrane metalloprotease [Saprospiraceae bacterium]|nr:CPBP family intramembrane metalloprotease [Saprospiraceae bacterium]
MPNQINWNKIGVYILLTFGISWTIAGIMWLLGISLGSTTSVILIAGLYMPGPALATFVLQKYVYKEGFQQYGWRFDKKAWKWLVATPLLFVALILLTFAIIGILGNLHIVEQFGQLDFSQEGFDRQLSALLDEKVDMDNINLPSLPPKIMFLAFIAQGIIAGSTVNLPFMFGEEFGWRGLLLRETQALGFVKSSLFIGIVWGLWHLPIVLMGHNYPSNPYWGVLMMCLFTTALCPLFAYVRLKTKSILGACMLHGMINATGALFVLYVANGNEFFSSIAGWAGVLAGLIIACSIYLLDKNFIRDFSSTNA